MCARFLVGKYVEYKIASRFLLDWKPYSKLMGLGHCSWWFLFLNNLPGGERVFCSIYLAVGFWRWLWCHLKRALLKITWINMPVMWLNCASVTNTDKHISARYVLSCVCVCDSSDGCGRIGRMGNVINGPGQMFLMNAEDRYCHDVSPSVLAIPK